MSSLQRKSSRQIGDVIKECMRMYGLAPRVNRQLLDKAWGKASGADQYTIRTFFRDGTFYVTVSSSVVRSQLCFQRNALLEKINEILSAESLFDSECRGVNFVRDLVIK